MNDQGRGSYEKPDYSELNLVKKVEVLENITDGKYKRVLFIRAFANTYLGYLDDEFFGYSVPQDSQKLWLMDAKQAVEYYEKYVPFKLPTLEYDTFHSRTEFRPFISALKFVKDRKRK